MKSEDIFDIDPQDLTPQQIADLQTLGRRVAILLERRGETTTGRKATADQHIATSPLQDPERKLHTLVDCLPVLAWTANADGWISWYNRRWYEYTGTTPQQMEGWGWTSVHDPSMLPAVLESWTGSIRSGRSFEMVFPLKGADGQFRPFLTRIEPLRGVDGEIAQWFGTNVEIDELHRTQLALEKTQAGLRQVMSATTDAVVSVNRNWTLTYLNPKAEQLYGLSEQLVGCAFWEDFPGAPDKSSPSVEHFHRAMQEGIAGSFELEYGEPLNFTLGVEVYPSEDGIVTFSRDITKLKSATAAILQNEKLAAVGRLASSIAHEINNPLEAVTNLLYLARTSDTLEEAQEYLGNADVELRRVAAIATQTLRFHRQATRRVQVTFATLVEGIFTGQHSRLINAGTRVEGRDRSVVPIFCLEGEIRQVLINFISNAIDSMHGRGGTLHLRGRDGRHWKTGKPGLIVTVADTGTGMSAAVRAKVFEAFYTTKGVGGTGLGLWISKEIVDRHQGTLSLRTSQNPLSCGTVVRLFLPEKGTDLPSTSAIAHPSRQ